MPLKTTKNPKPSKQPETPKATDMAAVPVMEGAPERKIFYPEVDVRKRIGEKALTAAKAKELLGWENEDEYKARRVTADPSLNPDAATFGSDFMLRDGEKRKVKCWYNSRNRPFSEPWAKAISQDILNHHWRLNLETIIISKFGTVLSGQHRLVGLILAYERWVKQEKWKAVWETEPTIECLVAVGCDESPDVIRTLDNTKPRLLADNIFTSPLFQDLSNVDRLLCSRMLASAVELLWNRTGASRPLGIKDKVYRTSSSDLEFIERHGTLLPCVKHLFEENKERQISVLKIQPGPCAALMYLMAASDSDLDTYRNAEPPSENVLDMGSYDRAKLFWTRLGNPKIKDMLAVRTALSLVVDTEDEDGGLGSMLEKHAILCKAWNVFKTGKLPTAADVALRYDTDEDGTKEFLEQAVTVEGIDLGAVKEASEEASNAVEELPEEELAARAEAEKEERTAEIRKKVEGKKATKTGPKPNGEVPKIEAKVGGETITRPMTRKEVEAEQTEKARKADEDKKKAGAQGKQPTAKAGQQANAKRPGNASK